MKIQFSDLNSQHKEIRKEIELSIKKVIDKGDFILGEDVALFESEFSAACHTKYAVGVSSGTDALFLALLSLDIKAGDEVIVPAFTYIATALAVSYTGAKPVFVDIDEKTYNIDATKIKKAISKNTKAIIPVHLYGQPANMVEILKVAKEHRLYVVEDAAQAHCAQVLINHKWQKAGSIGDIGCFSFYPSKNLGGLGDGGMVVMNSEQIYKKIRMLRDYGRISKYEHAVIGYNCRLDTLQAAVLKCKLKKLDKWNQMRKKAASIYDSILKNLDVVTPYVEKNVEHIYHVYAIRTRKRDRLFNALKNKGVSAVIHYPIPLHLQKAYSSLGYRPGDFAVAEGISRQIISLPIYPHISRTQIEYVCNIIRDSI